MRAVHIGGSLIAATAMVVAVGLVASCSKSNGNGSAPKVTADHCPSDFQSLTVCTPPEGSLCVDEDPTLGCNLDALPSGLPCSGSAQCSLLIFPCPNELQTDSYLCTCLDSHWSCEDCAPGSARCAVVSDAAPIDAAASDAAASDEDGSATGESASCGANLAAGEDGGCGYAELAPYPHNCGQCGHDCGGGACQAGACVPLPAGVLATGQHGPIAIAVDSANVYWLNVGTVTSPGPGAIPSYYQGGNVMKCAVGGCDNSPTILGSGWAQAGMYPAPSGLTVDSTNVYWSGGGNVLSCAISGCGCQPTVRAMVPAAGVTVASGAIYMTEYGIDEIALCPLSGCANGPSTFADSTGGPLGITHDDTNVYWVDVNGVLRECPLSGCGPAGAVSLLTPTAAGSTALTVDDTNLYWTNGNAAEVGSVEQCDKTAATATTLASGRSGPMGIAVDATDVYWVEGGSVCKCAIGGCGNSPMTVAATSGPAIALDATHLYVSQSAPSDGGDDSLDDYVVALPK